MSQNTCLIGGNSGIGYETAKLLQKQGHHLTAALRSADKLSTLGIPTQPFEATADDITLNLPERLDGFVYFPGSIDLKPFHQIKPEDFQKDWEINCLGAIKAIQAALPALKRSDRASIVLFSSVAVHTGMPFHASIAAAKGAVEGLARSLAAELAPKIRVNLIAPSLTKTELASSLLRSDSQHQAAENRHPLQQIGQPQDVAALVSYLLSKESSFTTGQVFRPDGGLSSIKLFS